MNLLYITHPLNGLVMISLAVGLGIFLTVRFKLGWRLWWIGGFTFFISQVGHIPFNAGVIGPLISNQVGQLSEPWQLPITALLLGLSAGIFEEFTRYAVYRWVIKDARSWSKGLLFGAGHGGIEAIILGIITLFTFIQLIAIKDVDLATIAPAEQIDIARLQISAYWSMPWYESLMGAVERLFAIPLHLAAAVLVLQSFTRNQFRWVLYAIGLHTLVNAVAVVLYQNVGVYWTELAIGILAIVDVIIILSLRQPEPISSIEQDSAELPPVSPIWAPQVSETSENLDSTRYQ